MKAQGILYLSSSSSDTRMRGRMSQILSAIKYGVYLEDDSQKTHFTCKQVARRFSHQLTAPPAPLPWTAI